MAGRQQGDTEAERIARLADLPHIDRLGPMSRAVVSESPIDVWVAQMIAEAPMQCFHPETMAIDDAMFARWLQGMISQKMAGRGPWRPMEPLRRKGGSAPAASRGG